MDNKTTVSQVIKYLLIVLLVVLIGCMVFLVIRITSTIEKAVGPIGLTNQTILDRLDGLLNPTPTIMPDPVTIIRDVQSLARLETIQFSVEKVITAEVNRGIFGPLFGDKLLLVAHGYVIAGIDLSKITAQDLSLKDDVLYVSLPDAEIFIATLDNDKSYFYDRTTGLFTKSDPNLETNARQAAEEEILNAALEDGILAQAQINAEVYLERLLTNLGYLRVVFN